MANQYPWSRTNHKQRRPDQKQDQGSSQNKNKKYEHPRTEYKLENFDEQEEHLKLL